MTADTFERFRVLKERLARRDVVIGTWITLGHPAVAETLAGLELDWLVVDMEHSAIGLAEAQALIRTISLTGAVPLVRVSDQNPTLVKRVMDAGACGIVVPDVRSAEQARAVVAAAKYPPVGTRGVGLARAQGYGLDFESYRAWVNEGSIVILQIEHVDGVKRLGEILEVEDVDGVIVGPYDLSASLGIPGELDDPKVLELVARVAELAKAQGVTAGYHVVPPDPEQVAERVEQGFNLIGYSLDTMMLGLAYRRDVEAIRTRLGPGGSNGR